MDPAGSKIPVAKKRVSKSRLDTSISESSNLTEERKTRASSRKASRMSSTEKLNKNFIQKNIDAVQKPSTSTAEDSRPVVPLECIVTDDNIVADRHNTPMPKKDDLIQSELDKMPTEVASEKYVRDHDAAQAEAVAGENSENDVTETSVVVTPKNRLVHNVVGLAVGTLALSALAYQYSVSDIPSAKTIICGSEPSITNWLSFGLMGDGSERRGFIDSVSDYMHQMFESADEPNWSTMF